MLQTILGPAKPQDNTASMMAELERLRKENEALKAANAKPIKPLRFKVSEKGACSVYGLGRFPTTLYLNQWIRIIQEQEELKKFLSENQSILKIEE